MNESPYQSMLENEVLFQQQPWLSRVPHQIRHAATPVADALTGAGAGLLAGAAFKRPLLGATIGGLLGGAHGLVAHNPSPAQVWAFNNPEKVHVLKARAAYDAGLGMSGEPGYEYGKTTSWEKLAVSPEWVSARLESVKDSTDEAVLDRLYKLRERTDLASNHFARKADKILDSLPPSSPLSQIRELAAAGHPDAIHYLHLDRQDRRFRTIERDSIMRARDRVLLNQHSAEASRIAPTTPPPAVLPPASAPVSPSPQVPKPPHDPVSAHDFHEVFSAAAKAEDRANEVTQALIRMGEKVDAMPGTPPAPMPAPTHRPPPAPAPSPKPSNLRRNLAYGAGALALPAAAYGVYRALSSKSRDEGERQGKAAALRSIGLDKTAVSRGLVQRVVRDAVMNDPKGAYGDRLRRSSIFETLDPHGTAGDGQDVADHPAVMRGDAQRARAVLQAPRALTPEELHDANRVMQREDRRRSLLAAAERGMHEGHEEADLRRRARTESGSGTLPMDLRLRDTADRLHLNTAPEAPPASAPKPVLRPAPRAPVAAPGEKAFADLLIQRTLKAPEGAVGPSRREEMPLPVPAGLESRTPLADARGRTEDGIRAAKAVAKRLEAQRAAFEAKPTAPPSPPPQAHAPAPAPVPQSSPKPSNLRRNLAYGAGALALPTAAYGVYRALTSKSRDEAENQGKAAAYRALGLAP